MTQTTETTPTFALVRIDIDAALPPRQRDSRARYLKTEIEARVHYAETRVTATLLEGAGMWVVTFTDRDGLRDGDAQTWVAAACATVDAAVEAAVQGIAALWAAYHPADREGSASPDLQSVFELVKVGAYVEAHRTLGALKLFEEVGFGYDLTHVPLGQTLI